MFLKTVFLFLIALNLSFQYPLSGSNGTFEGTPNLQNAHFNAKNLWLTINAQIGQSSLLSWLLGGSKVRSCIATTSTPSTTAAMSTTGEDLTTTMAIPSNGSGCVTAPVVGNYVSMPNFTLPCDAALLRVSTTELDVNYLAVGSPSSNTIVGTDSFANPLKEVSAWISGSGSYKLFYQTASGNSVTGDICYEWSCVSTAMHCQSGTPYIINHRGSAVCCYIEVNGPSTLYVRTTGATGLRLGVNTVVNNGVGAWTADPTCSAATGSASGTNRIYVYTITSAAGNVIITWDGNPCSLE